MDFKLENKNMINNKNKKSNFINNCSDCE